MSLYEKLAVALSALMLGAIFIQLVLMYRTFKADHDRRKKQSTLEFGSQLRRFIQPQKKQILKKYGNNIINIDELDEEYINLIREYLEVVEDLSVGVNTEIYDLDIVNRMYGNFLINMYEKCAPYIKKRRIEEGLNSLYEEYERLVFMLKGLRSTENHKGKIA